MMRTYIFILTATVCCVFLFTWSAAAAGITKLNAIRAGQHSGYTRLVFDSEGARPLEIGPVTADDLTIFYDRLELGTSPSRLFRELQGAVEKISHQQQANRSMITIRFKVSNTTVKTFYMRGKTSGETGYRLILDFYPEGSAAVGPGTLVSAAPAVRPSPPPSPVPASTPSPAPAAAAESQAPSAESVQAPEETAAQELPPEEDQTATAEPSKEEMSAAEQFVTKLSGELSLIGRYRNDDAKGSLFTQYKDPKAVSGEFGVKYEEPDRFAFQADGKNLGQDDVNLNFRGLRYGVLKGGITYDEIPHRFAFDVKTLYSGVGSGNMTLDNGLQSTLQGLAGDSAGQVAALNTAFGSADSGDSEIKRKKLSGDLELVALDPFSFRAEFSREEQDGTRPFFGSFGLDNALEIFEPIDNDTWTVKLIAEFAKKTYLLNATYYYQHFNNNEDTLTFDNPFRVDDALGEPSTGRIDLAPDNHYQNISLSGSYMNLPFNSRIAANAAWGWMRQDDDLPPFTTNTALVPPATTINYSDPTNLPVNEADVKVNTSLYNVTLNSKPLTFMRVQGKLRHYDYNNKTDTVFFPDGYVDTDAFAVTPSLGYPISTLPSSYRKTKADVNLGFDVWTRTRLNLDYTYNRTKRDDREVDKQTDHIFGGSIDTNPVDWGDLRLSYHRTVTDIDDYVYNVYLASGEDLQQLPGLRKYDQADVNRDRFKFLGNVYPIDPLVFSGSFTYGKDDFHDSPFGLTDVDYYSVSIDGDYALTGKLNLNAFYIYEKYKNKQAARGNFDDDGDGIPTITDWKAKGEDEVNTIGGGITYAVIPEQLEFKLSYSYSEVDGKIDFDIPGGSVPSFDMVDDSKLHTLDAKLKYNIWGGFFMTLGYVWEKFDYDDFNQEGFTYVPTDGSGNYNGAILADTLYEDYDAHIIYTKLSYRF